MSRLRSAFLVLFAAFACCDAASAQILAARPLQTWDVDGVKREGLVFVPPKATTEPTPVIFAFHGHGGTANHASRTFAYQRHWPEALVVYLQGLNTPGKLTDPEGKKTGWQHDLGEQSDRDLKFFDAVLADLRKNYRVDERRIYATGHSNGGGFTYLLWAVRGDRFAAVAPSAAVPPRQARDKLQPKPALHVTAENDPLVKYAWQSLAIDLVRKLNECGAEGKPWGEHAVRYESKRDCPLVVFKTDQGHAFPSEAPATIVKFFREHSRPAKDPTTVDRKATEKASTESTPNRSP